MAPSNTAFLDTFGQVRRGLHVFIDSTYGALGMGATQAKLIRRIGENRNLSQADLARATETDPALTGRALQTLLDRGWVRRRRSREDQRAFSLDLTESGQALLRQVLEARDQVGSRIRSVLSEDDLAAFERIAKKLLGVFPVQPVIRPEAERGRRKAGHGASPARRAGSRMRPAHR